MLEVDACGIIRSLLIPQIHSTERDGSGLDSKMCVYNAYNCSSGFEVVLVAPTPKIALSKAFGGSR